MKPKGSLASVAARMSVATHLCGHRASLGVRRTASLGRECSHGFDVYRDAIGVAHQPVEDGTGGNADSSDRLTGLASTQAPGVCDDEI